MRVAIYHPWVYLKSGLERTLLEIVRRSRHDWTIYTNHYDRDASYPELKTMPVVELSRVSVRRSYGSVVSAGLQMLRTKLDMDRFDALVISCEGLGDLITPRNSSRPVLCLCFTPLRATFDHEYRARLLHRAGKWRPLVNLLELGFRALDRFCWRRYSAVVAVSETIRQRIAVGGLYPADAVQILHPGIDEAQIRPSTRSDPYFLVPGRIMWTKNVELAVAAFELARPRLPANFRLAIAGMVDDKSRDYFAGLQREAARIGGIEFHSGPPDAEMRTLYDHCTAVLFTAFNEDWGLVPVEGMAAGKPVIGVNVGGPTESILDGVTGFLEPNDPAAFAERMVLLANDPALVRSLGAAATERAHLFTWQIFVSGLDDALERMVAEAKPSPAAR
ncbi:MAG: glycosyltransferase [Acetobacteraceae bacterium]